MKIENNCFLFFILLIVFNSQQEINVCSNAFWHKSKMELFQKLNSEELSQFMDTASLQTISYMYSFVNIYFKR